MAAFETNPPKPKISVIIPAYNHESYISEAVESVLTQSVENLEIIVVDDGSTDGTVGKLREIVDARLTVYQQENQGAARTINRGISLAQGRYVTVLNSDDVYHPRRLEIMSRYLDEHQETVLISSLVEPIDPSGKEVLPNSEYDYWLEWYDHALEATKESGSLSTSLLAYNFIVSTSNIFFRADAFASGPLFKEFLAYCHDYEFLLRELHDESFHLVEEKLLKYRLHPQNTIKENEFLRHLEVIYSIATSLDFEDFLSDLCVEKRKTKKLFKGLLENPDINPGEQLQQADALLKHFQAQLRDAHHKLYEANLELERQRVVINTKEYRLQEIYNSRGWRLVLFLRKIKHIVFRYVRFFKKNFTTLPGQGLVDEKTYHVKIRHSILPHRPKIVHAIGNLMMGGSSRLIVDLIEYLGHKYDQEAVVYFVPTPLAYAGFTFHELSVDWKTGDIEKFLREKEPKILHMHYWGDIDEWWYRQVIEATRNLSCTVIENINTPVAPLVDDRVDRYVYVSEYAMCFGPFIKEKSTVIHPGSDFTLFQRGDSPVPDNVIGMVYRLENDKLSEDSILPLIKVTKRRPSTRAIIVGGGTLLKAFKSQVAAEGVTDKFEFTDYVAYEQLPDLYKRFSVFVAPVWKESFGQVAPFAMSMQIPVVGYDVGALHEVLGGRDCLARDTEQLVDIIIDLLDNREKRLVIGAANCQRARSLYAVEAMVEKYDHLYKEILKPE